MADLSGSSIVIGRLRGVRPKQVRELYQSVISATTDFAASTWCARDRSGVREHLARLGRVQRMGAQLVIGPFRTVSSAVLQDEAGLEPVESRLARKSAERTLRGRALPHDHPLSVTMNGMERCSSRHKTPLFETWSRHHKVIQETKGLRVTPSMPHTVPPWRDHSNAVTIQDEVEAMRFHQHIAAPGSDQLLFYTDACTRNGSVGIAVLKYRPHGNTPAPRIVRQETIGRPKTCTVATAEIYAIRIAPELRRRERANGWIVTDSQEALLRIGKGGRSSKSKAVVFAALREISMNKEQGSKVGLMWVPRHKDITGNECAHPAAQNTLMTRDIAMVKPEHRIREHAEVARILRKEISALQPQFTRRWGKYTQAIDSALPGKLTLRLYGMLSHEDAGILAQARTGHTHLNEFLARINQTDSVACAYKSGAESVKHLILQCP